MYHRSFFPQRILFASIAAVSGMFLLPNDANAGFQWVAPATQEHGAGMPQVYSAPQPQVSPIVQYPAQPSPPPSQPSQIQQLQYHEKKEIENSQNRAIAGQTLNLSSVPLNIAPSVLPQMEAAKTYSPSMDDSVRGFANNVPLAVALRQVLPADVNFSTDQNVDMGTLVSWRGGASWRQTVENMLQPVGLSMQEQGKTVVISRGGAASTAVFSKGFAASAETQKYYDNPTQVLPEPLTADSGYAAAPPSYNQPVAAYSDFGLSVDTWNGNRGDTLRKVVEDWSKRANIEVSWQAEYDYPLQASVSITGNYEEAIRALLAGFQEAQPQPIGTIYNNQAAGQTVLVVTTRGNNYSD